MFVTLHRTASRPSFSLVRLGWLLAMLLGFSATLALPRQYSPTFVDTSRPVTPGLQKAAGPLSARLAALERMDWSNEQRAAALRALGLPPQGYGSLLLDRAGSPLVYVHLAQLDQPALEALASSGARVTHISREFGVVTAAVPPDRLADVAAVPGVLRLQEALAPGVREGGALANSLALPAAKQPAGPCPTGLVSEGDAQLHADRARAEYGVDGSGVTVGVLSGSYNVETATGISAAADIASGDLPGPGNPCGYATPVNVLAETRIGAGRDEGRAMLQIVHDLAPGASLAFATASDGLYAFADNIRRLRREARADVIVDDYYYPEEPFFQDGPINTAIRAVTQDGAIYVTSGGNIHAVDRSGRPIGSYEAPEYRPAACPQLIDAGGQPVFAGLDCHDFDPRKGEDALLAMRLPPGGLLALNFQWSEPWFGVATDYDIYLVDGQRHVLAQSIAGLGVSPAEFIGYSNTTSADQTVDLVVARVSGGAPRFKFTASSAAIAAPTIASMEYANLGSIDSFGPTVTDHALSAEAITVGAALYSDGRRAAPFSSHGPATVYWAPVESIQAALALPGPQSRSKPDIMATSGARTTFYGRANLNAPRCSPSNPANAVCRFFGTSASAPHVAGVMALIKQRAYQRDVGLDPALARQVLQQSAQPMRGTHASDGAGLADARRAVAAVDALPSRPAPAPAQLQMPQLVGLTEQQAREALLRLGVPAALIVSDYQDRAKLGDLFDRVAPFFVVSSLPAAGAPIGPGSVIVMGVRAPQP